MFAVQLVEEKKAPQLYAMLERALNIVFSSV